MSNKLGNMNEIADAIKAFKPKNDKTCAICGEEKSIFSFTQYSRPALDKETRSTWVDVCHSCERKAVEAILDQQTIHPGEHTFHKQQIEMLGKIY